MSLPVVYRLEAFNDLAEIVNAYDSAKSGLGVRFHAQVDARLSLVADQPYLFAIHYEEVRAIKVPSFPYVIFYCAAANQIEVIAILHGSRDPSAWQSRL